VLDNGHRVTLGGSKQRALLALLLLHANRVVSRDRLIDELWDGSPPETASTALQVHVSQLRKALGRDAIVTQAPGYLVRVEPGALDLEQFERLVKNAQGEKPEAAAEKLREALVLWRGPAFADLDDSVARGERAQLEEQHASALEQRVEADLELGRHLELVPELESLVREDPLRERRRAQLMLALYRSGRQADALDSYRSGRKLLADELGLEPGGELRQLEKAILEHHPALAPPAVPQRPEPTREERSLRLLRRSRLAMAIGALLLLGAAATIGFALTRGSKPVSVLPNSVAVLNPSSGKVEADIPAGGRPVSLALGAGSLWVLNADEQTILRIDTESKRVVQRIGGLGSNLSEIAFGYGFLWVAGGNDGTLTRVDPRHNGARQIELGKPGAAGTSPVFLVATGGGSIWTTRGNEVLRVDPRSSEVTAHVQVFRPEGLGAGPESAWAISQNEHIIRIDAERGRPIVDEDLSDSTFFPLVYAKSLWLIVGAQTPLVRRLEPGTLHEEASIPFPKQFPFDLAGGEDAVWTADHDGGLVWRIDPGTNQAKRIADLPHFPVSVAAGAGSVWVGVQRDAFT
jgi:DNA-binding SARP family transcriptional activator/streptogramin lyase